MENVARTVLDYMCWLLLEAKEDGCDEDYVSKAIESICYELSDVYTPEEQQAMMDAAAKCLSEWTAEPDEHGYTPRGRLTEERKSLLEDVKAGKFRSE